MWAGSCSEPSIRSVLSTACILVTVQDSICVARHDEYALLRWATPTGPYHKYLITRLKGPVETPVVPRPTCPVCNIEKQEDRAAHGSKLTGINATVGKRQENDYRIEGNFRMSVLYAKIKTMKIWTIGNFAWTLTSQHVRWIWLAVRLFYQIFEWPT